MGLRNGGVGWGLAEIFPRLFTFQSTERRLCASGGGVDHVSGAADRTPLVGSSRRRGGADRPRFRSDVR